MRLLRKLLMKLVMLVLTVLLMGSAIRYGQKYLMKGMGVPAMPGMPSLGGGGVEGAAGAENPQFSSEESDLMTTVFKSAIRLFTGQAKRSELASELSDKLYAGRADEGTMSELGIELVKPGGPSPLAQGGGSAKAPQGAGTANTPRSGAAAKARPGAGGATVQPGTKLPPAAGQSAAAASAQQAMLDRVMATAKVHSIELILVPVVLLGMVFMHRRRRHSPADDFILPDVTAAMPNDAEPYTMKHPVHGLKPEDFELLVALIYQRQGYRVALPAGLGGGSGGNFMLQRRAEKLLVVCKRLNQDHKVPVERLRELHDAVSGAGATRGLYVASCGFTWDARNFAKAKGLTAINARTLDELVSAAKERPDEDLLAVPAWAPKFMSKVELKTPLCPTCEAEMVQLSVSEGAIWVCSQRPDCKGRRSGRVYQKLSKAAEPKAELVGV